MRRRRRQRDKRVAEHVELRAITCADRRPTACTVAKCPERVCLELHCRESSGRPTQRGPEGAGRRPPERESYGRYRASQGRRHHKEPVSYSSEPTHMLSPL